MNNSQSNTGKRVNKGVVMIKDYSSYEKYLNHQKEKTTDPVRRKKWLGEEWEIKLSYFQNKYIEYQNKNFLKKANLKAIGLGARTGQEIQAFKNIGFDAIGIDIVASPPLVIEGDIHNIPFNDSSFDVAFSNIFDHSLYPEKFISEIERILVSQGIAILHIALGVGTDEYGVNEVFNDKAIVDLFKKSRLLYSNQMEPLGGLNWEIIMEKNQ